MAARLSPQAHHSIKFINYRLRLEGHSRAWLGAQLGWKKGRLQRYWLAQARPSGEAIDAMLGVCGFEMKFERRG